MRNNGMAKRLVVRATYEQDLKILRALNEQRQKLKLTPVQSPSVIKQINGKLADLLKDPSSVPKTPDENLEMAKAYTTEIQQHAKWLKQFDAIA